MPPCGGARGRRTPRASRSPHRALEGEERPHVEPERFVVPHGVYAIGPAFDDRRTGPGERVHGVGEQRGNLAGDGGLFVVEHDADAEILQPGMARRRQRPGVGLRRLVLGPGGDAQSRPEIAWGPAERAHRGHVRHVARRRRGTRRLEPGQRDDPDAGFESVDAAEARRDADGADEVRSVFEERHPGGQRRGSSRRWSRPACASCPTGLLVTP